jgi:hypothetical protein
MASRAQRWHGKRQKAELLKGPRMANLFLFMPDRGCCAGD